MKKCRKYTFLALMSALLCGCQPWNVKDMDYFRNHSKDYLKSSLIAPLRVPEGFSHHTLNTYPLPAHLPPADSLQPVSLVPPGFGELT